MAIRLSYLQLFECLILEILRYQNYTKNELIITKNCCYDRYFLSTSNEEHSLDRIRV